MGWTEIWPWLLAGSLECAAAGTAAAWYAARVWRRQIDRRWNGPRPPHDPERGQGPGLNAAGEIALERVVTREGIEISWRPRFFPRTEWQAWLILVIFGAVFAVPVALVSARLTSGWPYAAWYLLAVVLTETLLLGFVGFTLRLSRRADPPESGGPQ